MIASVVVDCKIDSVDRTFDYLVPPCFAPNLPLARARSRGIGNFKLIVNFNYI